MKNDANIVPFANQSKHPSAALEKLPAVLASVHDKASTLLKSYIQELFASADDALFEMADRATSNSEQNTLFEAMRDLRQKHQNIERSFLQHLVDSFAALNQHHISQPPSLETPSFESLSLVQNDVLEESVAIDSMVAKVKRRDELALQQLTARFNHIVSRKLSEEGNPLNANLLSANFIKSCNSINLPINIKLIILKLFEKHVINQLDSLYQTINTLLIDADILPSLKLAHPVRKKHPVSTSYFASPISNYDPTSTLASSDQLHIAFSELQALLPQLRAHVFPERQVPADAVPISSNDLMRLLSHMQQQVPSQPQHEQDLRAQLDQLLNRASNTSKSTRVVAQVDDDVINLVAMLFEFILDDRNLHDSLKALIARLQIPLLKVAVLDKTLFNQGNHPARRLLNEIASAALGWNQQDSEQRDNLYLKIEKTVQRTLTEFTDDPDIFNELLADFIAFTGNERRRSALLEQRTRDAEEGRARAETARLQVEHELNARLLGKTLPQVVVQLLQDAWSKVLLLSYLKNGDNSSEWHHNLATMDDLIWSIEAHDDALARLKLLQLVPSLLRQLRTGFSDAAIDPFVANHFFNRLEALHVQAFQRYQHKPINTAVASEATPVSMAQDPIDSSHKQLTAQSQQTDLPQPEPAVMVEVQEEILLQPTDTPDSSSNDVMLNDDDPALLQVDSLNPGCWIELRQDEQRTLRCKLAAIIKPTGRYIFVNRSGVKVLEKSRMALALDFKNNMITLLDNNLLFDRALESVIGNLRRLKSN